MEKEQLEEGTVFAPRFDDKGLITCVTVSARTGKVLMVAYMNEETIRLTLQTGEVHYWSRSRQEIWHKGASSGNTQKVVRFLADCDQDVLLAEVDMPLKDGTEVSCHTGREGCFYRSVHLQDGDITLRFLNTH